MRPAGMFVFNHCERSSLMCMNPDNEVLKYFMSRKLHTNTGSSVFRTKVQEPLLRRSTD